MLEKCVTISKAREKTPSLVQNLNNRSRGDRSEKAMRNMFNTHDPALSLILSTYDWIELSRRVLMAQYEHVKFAEKPYLLNRKRHVSMVNSWQNGDLND